MSRAWSPQSVPREKLWCSNSKAMRSGSQELKESEEFEESKNDPMVRFLGFLGFFRMLYLAEWEWVDTLQGFLVV